ncbi:MAG: hypothetical protein R3E45_13315 [Rhodocyclaceae bacterium]
MNPHRNLAILVACLAVLGTVTQPNAAAMSSHVTTAPFANGGVGATERLRMHAIAGAYPLHMSFSAEPDKVSLTRVPVLIRNARGDTVFELSNAGPLLYVALPDGDYTVRATAEGVTEMRRVSIHAGHPQDLRFLWSDGPGQVSGPNPGRASGPTSLPLFK